MAVKNRHCSLHVHAGISALSQSTILCERFPAIRVNLTVLSSLTAVFDGFNKKTQAPGNSFSPVSAILSFSIFLRFRFMDECT